MSDPEPTPPARHDPATSIAVLWPDGHGSEVMIGTDWLLAARSAGVVIPTACLGGRCGACEIEVNGQVVRACVSRVPGSRQGRLRVNLTSDPYW